MSQMWYWGRPRGRGNVISGHGGSGGTDGGADLMLFGNRGAFGGGRNRGGFGGGRGNFGGFVLFCLVCLATRGLPVVA